ncbi:MAG TPA: DUF5916 domain-containing protein [Gemmatimonadaceae bacterium]|jgi:hypothetical protein
MLAVAALAAVLNLQTPQNSQPAPATSPAKVTIAAATALVTDTGATAIHASTPPTIDGKDDDAVWRQAPSITDFTQWQPNEGKTPTFKTEAKVAYDAANLYVFVRAFDPHPDSIIKLLERRDSWTASDMIWLFVDSYHDRRTGYEFGVNAAGVKIDQAMYNGGNEDGAWDAVWDVVTRIDSLGWTAEFRIPMSQMRYSRDKSHIFGFTIDRDIYRFNERVSWPKFTQSKPDLVSQLGSLGGLDDLEAPRRMEAMPYVVTKGANEIKNNRFKNQPSASVGGDIKYRVASNLTLDATINPDFGQVESDPSVLNLSAYESFFDERRPFFVAGRGLFEFRVNCSAVNCGPEGLYYSRRIGRTPQLSGTYGDTVPASPTTIIGAGKLIGRSPTGLTVGVLDAVTNRESGPGDTTFEPTTNFTVVRATQDLRNGASGIGAMVTAVNRHNDRWSSPYLASGAYAGAVDFRHRFYKNTFEISGSLDASQVDGSRAVISRLQQSSAHYYQRPDANLPFDTTRTSLAGDAEELKFGKVSGQHLSFETSYLRRSPGFEINDMGFLRRADQQSWNTWMGFFDRREHLFYKRFQLNNNWWQYWSTAGLPTEAAYNMNTHINFKNNMGFHVGGTAGQLGTTYDDRAARGGPAVRNDPYLAPWMFINGDDRKSIVPSMNWSWFRGNGGRSWSTGGGPEIDYKMLGRFSSAFSVNWNHNVDPQQFYGRYNDATGTHYTFARLDQKTTSATIRMNYTFSPTVSIQAYTSPFVSKGTYSGIKQLSATPRASDYDARYAVFADTSVTNNPGGFNFKAFQSNMVFRWEYSPGSTLFVVWNEGRQGFLGAPGTNDFAGDLRELMKLHPSNVFLVKVSYWLNR